MKKKSKQILHQQKLDFQATTRKSDFSLTASDEGEDFFDPFYVFDSLSHSDIDLNSAIGELIDNSLEAEAENIYIDVIRENKGKKKKQISAIICCDDGCGMGADELRKALKWGGTTKKPSPNKKMGIGRFGVGLSAAANRIASRVEVYSQVAGDYYFTYNDINEIRSGKMTKTPAPLHRIPLHEGWNNPIAASKTGTVIIFTGIKNVNNSDIDELPTYIARTFRKFIEAGRKIYYSKDSFESNKEREPLRLHDPLFLAGPTRFDDVEEGKSDLRGTLYQYNAWNEPIVLLGSDEKEHEVKIKCSITPKEWRKNLPGDGQSKIAKDHRIPDNEGVSILRANREVCYGKVPKLIGGEKGRRYEEKDRWWSMEISYEPELDDYFNVQFIKRGIEPNRELKAKIRKYVGPTVRAMVEEIDRNSKEAREEARKDKGVFNEAEERINDKLSMFPKSHNSADFDPEKAAEQAEKVYANVNCNSSTKEKRKKKAASFGRGYQFETEELLRQELYVTHRIDSGKTVITLNTRHPFYRDVIEPLLNDNEKDRNPLDSEIVNAIMMLFASHEYAVDQFSEAPNNALFDNQRREWGSVLSTLCGGF